MKKASPTRKAKSRPAAKPEEKKTANDIERIGQLVDSIQKRNDRDDLNRVAARILKVKEK